VLTVVPAGFGLLSSAFAREVELDPQTDRPGPWHGARESTHDTEIRLCNHSITMRFGPVPSVSTMRRLGR
jgi:hypothetical protein